MPAPTNTDCASAEVLTGLGGTVTANNSLWAGTWPVGGDPLFNAVEEGGGAPLWYKWTNTTGVRKTFLVVGADAGAGAVVYNLGIAKGTCSSLDMVGTDIVHWSFNGRLALSFNEPTDSYNYDLLVEPGETIFVEIDGYSGDTSEPPTLAPGDHGDLKFVWSIKDPTFWDGIPPSTLLQPTVCPTMLGAASIRVIDGIQANNRYYFVFETVDGGTGNALWAGDCAADGSDLHTFEVSDSSGIWALFTRVNDATQALAQGIAELVSDGSRVWLVVPHNEVITNPDDVAWTSQPDGGGGTLHRTQTTISQYQIMIFEWNSGTHDWNLWFNLQSSPMFPDLGPAWGGSFSNGYSDEIEGFAFTACASSSDPGVVHITDSWVGQTFEVSNYTNDSGLISAFESSNDVQEYVETFSVSNGGIVLENRLNHNYNIRHTFSFNSHTGVITYANGNWITTGTFTSVGGSFVIESYNDVPGGQPIVVLNKNVTIGYASTVAFVTPEDGVTFYDPIGDADLASHTWADFKMGLTLTTPDLIQNIAVTPASLNPNSGVVERFISTRWITFGFTALYCLVNRIPSSGAYTLAPAMPGDTNSIVELVSVAQNARSVFFDGTRNLIVSSATPTNGIEGYDNRCHMAWEIFYSPRFATAEYNNTFGSQRGFWDDSDPDNPYLILLGSNNELRQYFIARDWYICSISGGKNSIFWFFKDGVWHHQNVDTELSLYMFKNGAWHQDGADTSYQLMGQLDGTWQT